MANDELGLRIDGRIGVIDAEALLVGLRALLRLLGTPPAEGDSSERSVWALSTLRESSAILAVRPGGVVSAESEERIRVIIDGIEQLDQSAGEPPGWGTADMENLLAFQNIVGMTGVEGVSFLIDGRRTIPVSAELLDHARSSLSVATTSLGSVSGHLDRYIGRSGHREVGLRDDATGRAVTITYPESLQEQMLAALEHDVVIWGEVRRNSQGRKMSVRAHGVDVIHYGPPEPVRQLVGILGDLTGPGGSNSDQAKRG
jgi:hypothetical protein